MKNFFVFMLLLLGLGIQQSMAQESDEPQQKLQINGEVKDFLSQKAVDTMIVEIIKDGFCVDTADVRIWGWGNRRNSSFSFTVTQTGTYQIRIWSPGFKTKYVPVTIDKFHKNERFRSLDLIYMQKVRAMDEVNLDEVTVTATRLKFYTNGDTLVYDATAFQMAEGSMLDALIKKLPGVELKDGGEIYVNGKKVDELQLNGRQLLDSDKELFMENLPAYMVKNIGVHEQTPREYVGTTLENSVEKETVMNVKMKREYAKGWIFNLEGGIGAGIYDVDEFSPDKFLARLFASRFSDKSRLTIFANLNNLNDYRDPGEQGSWTPLSQSTGLMETYKLGVTGSKYSDGDVMRYNGSGNVTYSESTTNTWGNSQTDFNTVDPANGNSTTTSNFGRNYNLRNSYDTRVQTQHRFNYNQRNRPVLNHFKNVFADANVNGSYHNYSNNSTNASATLDKDVRENWGKDWLDSLLNPMAGDLLMMYAVNRNITRAEGEGHEWAAGASARVNASPLYNDRVMFNVNASYNFNDNSTPSFEHRLTEYPKTGAGNLDQNRYNDNFMNSSKANVGAGINYTLDNDMKHNLSASYGYNYSNTESNQSLYMLHLLEGWSSGERELGMLPSVREELLSCLDKTNSSYTHTKINTGTPEIGYRFMMRSEQGGFSNFNVRLALPTKSENIDYRKGGVDTVLSRTTTFAEPSISFMKNNWQKGQSFNVSYNLGISAPNLTQMVDLVDTRDPLNVTHGNPNLENAISHRINARYRDKFADRYQLNASALFQATSNEVAMGYVMDPETGKRVSTPENVDGNWRLNTSLGAAIPLDKDQRNVINANASYGFTNSVDLSSTSKTAASPVRSVVGSHNTQGSLRYDCKPASDVQFGLNATVSNTKTSSERVDFNAQNVWNVNYGANLQFQLIGGLQVSTDLTMYTRRGMTGAGMNTDELVWNARISKSLLKGKLTLMLDAFDLLHNLSNIRYSVNAQGHTETYSNVIPSYALFHVVWKFTKNKGDKGKSSAGAPEMDAPRGGFGPGNGGGQRPAGGGFGGGRPPMGGGMR